MFVVLGGFIAFFFAFISDKVGRKKIFIISYFLTIIGSVVSLFSFSLPIYVIGKILVWSGMDTFFSMVYVYSNEIIGSGLRSKTNGFLFFCWGLGEIVISIINIWITNYRLLLVLQFLPLLVLGFSYIYL